MMLELMYFEVRFKAILVLIKGVVTGNTEQHRNLNHVERAYQLKYYCNNYCY